MKRKRGYYRSVAHGRLSSLSSLLYPLLCVYCDRSILVCSLTVGSSRDAILEGGHLKCQRCAQGCCRLDAHIHKEVGVSLRTKSDVTPFHHRAVLEWRIGDTLCRFCQRVDNGHLRGQVDSKTDIVHGGRLAASGLLFVIFYVAHFHHELEDLSWGNRLLLLELELKLKDAASILTGSKELCTRRRDEFLTCLTTITDVLTTLNVDLGEKNDIAGGVVI